MTTNGSVPRVRVEFYGLARLRAGRPALEVEAATVGEALRAADAALPALGSVRDGRLSPEYLVTTNARGFTPDLTQVVTGSGILLVFGADAGG